MHELHKILGQMDLLGSPILLTSSLVTGVASFFAEPAKARSPREFAHGVGHGTLVLLRSTAFGLCHALGQVRGRCCGHASMPQHQALNSLKLQGVSSTSLALQQSTLA